MRYDTLRNSLADAGQKIVDFTEEMADKAERLEEIPILKSSILKMKTARHAEQEIHRCQLTTLQSELESVVASSKSADNQARLQIEDAIPNF